MSIHLKMTRSAVAVSLLAMAAACGGGGSSTNNPTVSTNMQGATANASGEAMPSGPFAQTEMQMHERMMAATGANASETWARKMIEHHRGAVQMSQLLIDQGGDPGMVQMARQTVEKQQREITQLERMVAGGITGGSGEANPYRSVEQQMHQQMMAASGANLSETWARKMITHHQGAVDMSELIVRQGGNPQVVAMARRTADDQRREIAHLDAMLRGEAMAAGGAPAAAPAPTPAAKATPAPAKEKAGAGAPPAARQQERSSQTKPAPRPAQRDRAAPQPAPKATPTPTPPAACTPEHRALGHC